MIDVAAIRSEGFVFTFTFTTRGILPTRLISGAKRPSRGGESNTRP